MNKKWYEFYCYENNEDLIIKLCKKFKLQEPTQRMNCFGGTNIAFTNGLKVYIVEFDEYNEEITLKRRSSFDRGKSSKEYANPIKKFNSGNIWYEIIKFISNDSKL